MIAARVGRRRALAMFASVGASGVGCGEDAAPGAHQDASFDDDARATPDDAHDAHDAHDDFGACDAGLGAAVGAVENFPNGQFFKLTLGSLAGTPVVIVRDDDGFYAMRAICTHALCALDPPDAFGNTRCPCHGARFSGRGDPFAGPATVTLAHLRVSICRRTVYVDETREVDPYARAIP